MLILSCCTSSPGESSLCSSTSQDSWSTHKVAISSLSSLNCVCSISTAALDSTFICTFSCSFSRNRFSNEEFNVSNSDTRLCSFCNSLVRSSFSDLILTRSNSRLLRFRAISSIAAFRVSTSALDFSASRATCSWFCPDSSSFLSRFSTVSLSKSAWCSLSFSFSKIWSCCFLSVSK